MNNTVIIGAGPAGLLSALHLHQSGIPITLIGPYPKNIPGMLLALHPKHIRFLNQLGIELNANFIDRMQLDLYQSHLEITAKPTEPGLMAIIDYNALLFQLLKHIKQHNICWHPVLPTALNQCQVFLNQNMIDFDYLIACDGANSWVRNSRNQPTHNTNYQQIAITALLNHSQPLTHAYQKFSKYGTLALLPTTNAYQSGLVWSLDHQQYKIYQKTGIETHIKNQSHVVGRVLQLKGLSQRPLYSQIMSQFHEENTLYIGTSAHHIHPLAGLGFNLTISDIQTACMIIKRKQPLKHYTLKRIQAHTKAHLLTDTIAKYRNISTFGFSTKLPRLKSINDAILKQVDEICLPEN